MSTDINDLMRKAKSYWYEDGMVETLAGLFFVAVGLILLADWAAPDDWPWKWALAPIFAVVTIVWIFGGRKIISWLKEHITYPRTGYVAYAQQGSWSGRARAILGGILGAAISIVLVATVINRQDIVRLIPLIMGTGVALLLLRIGSSVALTRFYIVALWSLLVGSGLAWSTADMGLSVAVYYAALGAAVAAAGVITFIRYLRSPAPEVGDD